MYTLHFYSFCHDSGFSYKQAELYLGLVRSVFERCMVAGPDGVMPSTEDAVKMFYDMMVSTTALKPLEHWIE